MWAPVLERYPDGLGGPRFMQKNVQDHDPDWIRRVEVSKEGGTVVHPVCDGNVVKSAPGTAPTHADLVFSHRPIDELPPIVEEAKRVGARAVWQHSVANENERDEARRIVESAGLVFIDAPYIVDAINEIE